MRLNHAVHFQHVNIDFNGKASKHESCQRIRLALLSGEGIQTCADVELQKKSCRDMSNKRCCV